MALFFCSCTDFSNPPGAPPEVLAGAPRALREPDCQGRQEGLHGQEEEEWQIRPGHLLSSISTDYV